MLNISAKLVGWGHEVDVLTSDFLALNGQDKITEPYDRVMDIGVFRFFGRAVARTTAYSQRLRFPGFVKRLLTSQYDVIHCHSIASQHFDLSWWVAHLTGTPLVVTGHYSPDDLDRLWSKRRKRLGLVYPTARLMFWRTWMRFALRRTSLIIAIAASERERLIRYLGVSPESVVVIPNGVEPEEFDGVTDAQARAFRNSRDIGDERLVLFVGRICHLKGPDVLVEAALELVSKEIHAKFLLVGYREDSGLAEALEGQIHTAGASHNVKFEELPRPGVLQAIKAADVVVLPSRGEVFGIVLVEGMYCGKVVIGSDAGGIPEVIDDGRSGYLFKNGDSRDLARVLERVIAEYDTLEELRSEAHRRAVALFTWERAAAKLQEAYKEIMTHSRRGRSSGQR